MKYRTKKNLATAKSVAIAWIVTYLAFLFVTNTLSPFDWAQDVKGLFTFALLCMGFFAFVLTDKYL